MGWKSKIEIDPWVSTRMGNPVRYISREKKKPPLGGARKFVSDVAVRGLFQVLNALKGLLYLPLISKQFGAHGYGIWSQVIITITLFSPILNLGLGDAVVRYLGSINDQSKRARSFFSAAAVVWLISIVAFLSGLFASRPIAQLMFNDSSLINYVVVFLGLLVMRVNLTFVLSYYYSISSIRLYTAFQTIEILADLVALMLLTLFFHKGLFEALEAFIAIDFCLILYLLIDVFRREGVSLHPDSMVLKKYLRYGLPLVPTVALAWVINSSDRFVIVHYLGLEKVGIYSAAYRLVQVLKLFVQPISFVLLPLISRMWEAREQERVRKYMEQSIRYYVFLAVPASAGLIALGSPLLRFLGTQEFSVTQSVIAALTMGIFFVGLYQIYVYVVFLREKTRVLPGVFFLIAGLNLGLNIVFVPIIGILGAAFTTFLCYFMQFAAVYWYTKKLFKIPVQMTAMVKSMASSGAMYIALIMVPTRTVLEAAIKIPAGAAIYLVLMLLLKGIHKEELLRIFLRKNRESQ